VIAVNVLEVAVASSVLLAVLLTLLVFLFVRIVGLLNRALGGTVSSRWLTLIGVAISVAGLVALIWTQVQGPLGGGIGLNGSYRWQIAMGPLDVIGIGLLVSIAAQILRAVQLRRVLNDVEAGPIEH
jgi:hypothetical protein